MRILTKFDIRNSFIVKGINYEGVEKVGNYMEIYNKVNNYIKFNINNCFENILNDVTASLYQIKSGEKDITHILNNKNSNTPHIYSGGLKSIQDVENVLQLGCDRIMINTGLHDNINLISDIVRLYGAQILIPSIETRYINGDYYVYKNYGREDTNIKLLDWLKILKDKGVIEVLIISMDKDGTLNGYDSNLLNYMKDSKEFNSEEVSFLYAGGIKNELEIKEIENNYKFIKGVSISSLFYKKIQNKIYFLYYLKGNINSVFNYYNKFYDCKIVNSIKDIPKNGTLCISGHYNSYHQIKLLKKHNDFENLKDRLDKNMKYIGICSGLQILLKTIKNETNKNEFEKGLDILPFSLQKCKNPQIMFKNNKFYCHSYEVIDLSGNKINEYNNKNILAYQFHPENSL